MTGGISGKTNIGRSVSRGSLIAARTFRQGSSSSVVISLRRGLYARFGEQECLSKMRCTDLRPLK